MEATIRTTSGLLNRIEPFAPRAKKRYSRGLSDAGRHLVRAPRKKALLQRTAVILDIHVVEPLFMDGKPRGKTVEVLFVLRQPERL